MLSKTYEPREVEARLYEMWESSGAFFAGKKCSSVSSPFCCILPPPNVTGFLHMGHALNVTIQDIVCRFERMRGKDVLWQPGSDHAGIATQMVVERQLSENGEAERREIGRTAFLERVWQWKAQYGETILSQLKRLGASSDWSRIRFTMDEDMSHSVVNAFVTLYRDGLIYKDKRLVNWDPRLLTAISDLEVEQKEVKGHLWYFRYPVEGEPDHFVTIATTRPETLLGDTAISVHPEDERYKALIGKHVILPLIGRRLPVVADSYSDPEKGTGAVKITPAHDFNDFELGKRHNLERINVFDQFACLFLEGNAAFLKACHPPEETMALHGLGRFDARIRVVEMMERKGFLEKVDEHTHMVPFGTRSDELIEPWLTDQWYLDASALAVPAIESVKAGRTVFVPKSWEKTYFDWMQNIQPWCISRQLWWGHQIPAWYGPKHPRAVDSGFPSRQGEIFVAGTEDEALTLARDFYPPEYEVTIAGNDRETDMSRSAECEITAAPSIVLFRDEDVLDTWFSSGLWPFSTLGWPNDTSEFQRFYPTDLLVTGFDIIFFWVARMMMLGIYFTKKEPFKTVYIHALVRDESGQKMSKSKGNVIDPLELIELHGADVLRFTLSIMAAQGRDIKLSRGRLEGYRNFITKLWNSVRFAQMNECFLRKDFDPGHCKTLPGRWIAGEVERAVISVTSDIERHRYNEAAEFLYRFVWNRFCDWYLELAKPVLNGPDEAEKIEIQSMTAWVLDQILLLLHPFIPFVTEELWLETGDAVRGRDNLLILSSWPHFSSLSDRDADEEMQWLIDLVSKIRSVRAEINVPAGSLIPLAFISASSRIRERVDLHATSLKQLGRIDCVDFFPHAPDNSVEFVSDDCVVALCLAGVVDLEAEKLRLEGEVEKITTRIEKMNINLSNAAFLSRAPEHVVEKQKAVCLEAELTRDKIYESLARVLSALK